MKFEIIKIISMKLKNHPNIELYWIRIRTMYPETRKIYKQQKANI